MITTLSPSTFPDTVAQIQQFALREFDREIIQKTLYYHNYTHIENVQRRARLIFQHLLPFETIDAKTAMRSQLILDLCSIAHDMVQLFLPQTQTHSSRKRESGMSELTTIRKLLIHIQRLNHQLEAQGHLDAVFSLDEMNQIRDAIEGTICAYSVEEQAIYQPRLYNPDRPPSLIALALALADIGALGMDGIQMYNEEGSLVFLEENPDIIPFLQNRAIDTLQRDDPELCENFRQRLLKRARFQVYFARSRLARTPCEIQGLPTEGITTLLDRAFPYLNQKIIEEVEQTTPTDDTTSLPQLLHFFQLEYLVDQP
jgi:hypothetical protein